MGYVYVIRCKLTPQVYVGKTVGTLEQRFKRHMKAARDGYPGKFADAIRDYGEANFWIEPLFESTSNIVLLRREAKFVKQFNSYKKGFNSTRNGRGKRKRYAKPR